MSRRPHGGRPLSKTVLILTEGESEEDYFKRYIGYNSRLSVVPISLKRHDSKNIMPFCDSKVKERGTDTENGDTVAIVIDVDERTEDEVKMIEQHCLKHDYHLFLSNRSFEVWLIMHFRDISRPMEQDELEDMLSECLRRRYRKSEGIRKDISDGDVEQAIMRASKHIHELDTSIDACLISNPSTTVHFLAQALNKSKSDPKGTIKI